MEPPELCLETRSVEETEALGERIGRRAEPGLVIALRGEMGTGKTAFARGIGRGLEIEDPVTSPTFTLMQEYQGRLPLYHFDAWMAGREALFLEGGGASYLGGEGVAVVEWAERVQDYLAGPRLELEIRHAGEARRRIFLRRIGGPAGTGAAPRALYAAIEALDPLFVELAQELRKPGED